MRNPTPTLMTIALASLVASSALAAPPAPPADPSPADFVVSQVIPAQQTELTWINLAPGAKVTFGVSTMSSDGGPCSANGFTCLAIEEPTVIGTAQADIQGVARLTVRAPKGLADDMILHFQALAQDPSTEPIVSAPYKRLVGEDRCKTATFAPVCGADGRTYLHTCEAEAHGQAVQYEAKCH